MEINSYVQFIPAYWLPQCNPVWDSFVHLASKHFFHETETIVDQYSPRGGVYYLQKGSAKCVYLSLQGHEKVLYYCKGRALFSDGPGVSNRSTTSSVTALTKCIVYRFPRDLIIDSLVCNHEIVRDLLFSLASKVCMFAQQVQGICTFDVEQAVSRILYWLLTREGKILHRTDPNLTRQDIANMLGVHRVTIVRALMKLKEKGILLRFTKHDLNVADINMLKANAHL